MGERMDCDMICLLGDLLNYGPRNGLPTGLDPIGVAHLLNRHSERILAVRGNCDSEVDQMLLHFPIMQDFTLLADNGKKLFLTHGHRHSPESMPSLACHAFVYGHTHLWQLERTASGIVCNTGSITFPKGGNPPTLVLFHCGRLAVHTLEGDLLSELRL